MVQKLAVLAVILKVWNNKLSELFWADRRAELNNRQTWEIAQDLGIADPGAQHNLGDLLEDCGGEGFRMEDDATCVRFRKDGELFGFYDRDGTSGYGAECPTSRPKVVNFAGHCDDETCECRAFQCHNNLNTAEGATHSEAEQNDQLYPSHLQQECPDDSWKDAFRKVPCFNGKGELIPYPDIMKHRTALRNDREACFGRWCRWVYKASLVVVKQNRWVPRDRRAGSIRLCLSKGNHRERLSGDQWSVKSIPVWDYLYLTKKQLDIIEQLIQRRLAGDLKPRPLPPPRKGSKSGTSLKPTTKRNIDCLTGHRANRCIATATL